MTTLPRLLAASLATTLVVGCYSREPAPEASSPAEPTVAVRGLAVEESETAEPSGSATRLGTGDLGDLGDVGIMPLLIRTLDEAPVTADCDFDDPFDPCQ